MNVFLGVRRVLVGDDIPTAIEYAAMVALFVGLCILVGQGLGVIPA